jgi:DNA-binding transcriptional LysR family regulator
MPDHLDPELLRTFLAAVDAGGLMRAAARVGRTRSAVSLQMRRLQELIGRPLFRKVGRGLQLTSTGDELVGYARRLLQLNDEALASLRAESPPELVRVGAPQDVAERWLPAALGRFARAHPQARLELRVDHSRALLELARSAQLDLCVHFAIGEEAEGLRLGAATMAFLAARRFTVADDEPLPLVLLAAPCAFRGAALAALDEAGRAWRIAVTAPSLSVLWAATAAGLGVTARAMVAVPASLRSLGRAAALPRLPGATLALYGGEAGSAALRALRREIADELRARLGRARRERSDKG